MMREVLWDLEKDDRGPLSIQSSLPPSLSNSSDYENLYFFYFLDPDPYPDLDPLDPLYQLDPHPNWFVTHNTNSNKKYKFYWNNFISFKVSVPPRSLLSVPVQLPRHCGGLGLSDLHIRRLRHRIPQNSPCPACAPSPQGYQQVIIKYLIFNFKFKKIKSS